MEGAVFSAVFSFEVGAYDFAFVCGFWSVEVCGGEEVADLGDVLLYPLPVVIVVGYYANFALWFEDAVELFEVLGIDGAAFVVSFFWPGVGEVDVEDGADLVGEVVADELGCIGAEDSYMLKVVSADAVGGVAEELARPFYAEVIDVGLGGGLLDEEGSFAGADFYVEGIVEAVGREPGARIDCAIFIWWERSGEYAESCDVELFSSCESEAHGRMLGGRG